MEENTNTALVTDTPKIWLGCVACYSSGRLVGEWLDVDTEDLPESCTRCDSKELHVFDSENLGAFGGREFGLKDLQTIRQLFASVLENERDTEEFSAYVDGILGVSYALKYPEESLKCFLDTNPASVCESKTELENWAWDFAEDCELLPRKNLAFLSAVIDPQALTNYVLEDLQTNEFNGKTWIWY